MKGTGIIIDGTRIEVPDVTVVNYLDDPRNVPPVTDFNPRNAYIRGVVMHTVHGKRGVLRPGLGPKSPKAAWYTRYQTSTSREVSWDCTGGTDGVCYWQNDPIRQYTWHAGTANGFTVGIEMVQEKNGDLYATQMVKMATLLDVLAETLNFPKQFPAKLNDAGVYVWDPARIERITKDPGSAHGVYGHCNQTTNRGPGDPGKFIFEELQRRGWRPFDFVKGEDIVFWKKVQSELGLKADGLPGPATDAALRKIGGSVGTMFGTHSSNKSPSAQITGLVAVGLGAVAAAMLTRKRK